MKDLIDRGRLKERLFPVVPDPRGVSKPETSLYMQGWNDAITSIIENEPSEEPKKGKWTNAYDGNDGHVKCTACFKTYDYITQAQHFNYCPNCGAQMEVTE